MSALFYYFDLTMKYYIYVVVAIIIATACSTSNKYELVKGKKKTSAPPVNVKINDSIFVDYLEITYIAFSEYQYYLSKIYGADSQEVQEATLDTLITNKLKSFMQESSLVPMDKIKIENLPVVGITYDQAIAYTEWRTSVVLELSLIEQKLLYDYKEQDADSHFTPEGYFSGEFTGSKPSEQIDFLVYRLPTEQEWEMIYELAEDKSRSLTTITETQATASQSIQFINDNVSELISEKGKAKGGNWISGDRTHYYEGSEVWLGFRCVAEVTSSEEYMKNRPKKRKRRRSKKS